MTDDLDVVPMQYRIHTKVKYGGGSVREVVRCVGRASHGRQCSREGTQKIRYKGQTVYVCIHHRPRRPVVI